ncbi:MAG: hypothetical protein A2017_17045 [Lentisphaerae bacterium GWF2_44_16]|nr:MAG: hypothetical protein A2017_17045 [Lentisphaerae bacterium GWF2_44_16]
MPPYKGPVREKWIYEEMHKKFIISILIIFFLIVMLMYVVPLALKLFSGLSEIKKSENYSPKAHKIED